MMYSFDGPKAHLFGFLLLRIQTYVLAALYYSGTQNQPLPSLNSTATPKLKHTTLAHICDNNLLGL